MPVVDELATKKTLEHFHFIAEESLRIYTTFACHSAFHDRHGVPFTFAVKAALLRTILSIRGEIQFADKVSEHVHLREFIGLPCTDWAQALNILSHDMDLFIGDECIRGLLLAIIGTARAAGLLASCAFQLDQHLLFQWAASEHAHSGHPATLDGQEPKLTRSAAVSRRGHFPVPSKRQAGLALDLPPSPPLTRMGQVAHLTERQFDVLRHLLHGKSNKRIAIDLGITEGTVKIHLAAIFRTLNVSNRTEAAIAAKTLPDLAHGVCN